MAYETIAEQLESINPALAESIQQNAWMLPLVILQILMKVIFYPIALYHSAKHQKKAWFIVLFVGLIILNDFGLLPILYLAFNRDIKQKPKSKSSRKKR